MRITRVYRIFMLVVALLSVHICAAQYQIPKVPALQTSLYDYANLLSNAQKKKLETKLINYSDSTTTQIVVITIESLKNEDINQLATRWAHTWGFGQKKEDNGVIILVAKDDRKIAIQAGYGLEDRLTAGQGGEIIRNVITPEFKNGNYYEGLDKGADELLKVFTGKYKGERKSAARDSGFPFAIIVFAIVMIIAIASKKGRGGGNNRGNRGGGLDLGDILILTSLGRGFGGRGGFGGGGFGGGSSGGFGGGFGGGGFSGGGSSGSW
jgi:uncharacterized protein